MNRDNRNEDRYGASGNRDRRSEGEETGAGFGYGGHFGAGGSYGSFGGPATSRLNIPDQRDQDKRGAYSSDYGYQSSEGENRGSGMNRLTGGHRGKGPRGYQRSDTRIMEDVNEELSNDPYLDASGIEVNIENGNVILTGHVDSKNTKRRAEDIAEAVRGVTNVENRLHVGKGMMEYAARAFTEGIGDVSVGSDRGMR